MHSHALLLGLALTAGLTACIPGGPEPTASGSATSGSATSADQTSPAHRQRPLQASQRALDWALDGPGYFKLRAADGSSYYTRQGSFSLDPQGRILGPGGLALDPAVNLPEAHSFSHIDPAGSIWARPQQGTPVQVAQLSITLFEHPEALDPVNASKQPGLFRASPAAGPPQETRPHQESSARVIGHAREDLSLAPIPLPDAGCRLPRPATETGKVLQLAILGQGFFQLVDPHSGERYYTRLGDFQPGGDPLRYPLNEPQILLSHHGFPVDPYIVLEANQQISRIDPTGTVWARIGKAPETNIGQIKLYHFTQPERLRPVSYAYGSLYRAPADMPAHEAPPSSKPPFNPGTLEPCPHDLPAQPK